MGKQRSKIRQHSICALLAVFCANCQRPEVKPPEVPPVEVTLASVRKITEKPVSKDVLQRVIEEVTRARGLPLGTTVVIKQLPIAEFKARLREQEFAGDSKAKRLQRALLAAFEIVTERPYPVAPTANYEDVVAAYYDVKRDEIVLPYLQKGGDLEEHLNIFAHEVHHAVQHRRFHLVPSADEDTRLAMLSLTEGDAQLAMASYIGDTRGIPVKRIVRRATDIVADIPISGRYGHRVVVRAGINTSSLMNFPYVEGMRFTGDLYRTGGFELVNAAYRSPPTATSHILHPQRYIDGVMPDEIPALTAPPKQEVVIGGRWGELRTRAVLGQCAASRVAANAAADWFGDRYLVTRDSEGNHQLRWLLTFADYKGADEFAYLLQSESCKAMPIDGLGDAGVKHFWIKADGRKVAVVRGMKHAQARASTAALLRLKIKGANREPLADAVIPERKPIPARARGLINKQAFTSEWLGIRTPALKSAKIQLDDTLEVTLKLPKGFGMLALYDFVPTGKSLNRLFEAVRNAVEKAIGLHTSANKRTYTSKLGKTHSRHWVSGNTSLLVRVVPICRDTGAIVMVALTGEKAAQLALERWMNNVQWLDDESVPACGWLNPE